MLAKCVNPVCSNQFRFLHQGKLLQVEIQFLDKAAAVDHREVAKSYVSSATGCATNARNTLLCALINGRAC